MEKRTLINVLNIDILFTLDLYDFNIYSLLETYGQSSNLYLNIVHLLTPVLIRQW
jgi:hypothetical protein